MKIAVAGKGGTGKTSISAWLGDYVARTGKHVWLVDADTALSLGRASGLEGAMPEPLTARKDLIQERIGQGMISLSPEVGDLPESLGVDLPLSGPAINGHGPGRKRLLVMGSVAGAGEGCACSANSLLKALLAHLILEHQDWVIVDLEAGVEHLGRGTAQNVDGLVIVSEPSLRGLETAAHIGRLATELGIERQVLALNRAPGEAGLPNLEGLPKTSLRIPPLSGLIERQLASGSVLSLPEAGQVDGYMENLAGLLG